MAKKDKPEDVQPNSRSANGESSIYYGADGYWHGRVTMGIRDDGKPDRRHIMRKAGPDGEEDLKTRDKVAKLVRELEKQRDQGTAKKAGPKWTVEKWLRHWVEEIAAPTVRYKTITTYRTVVYKHLIPGIGAHRLERIEPEHFEKLYKKLIASGLKPVSVHQVHRVARTAFNEALRRGHIGRNAAALAKPPMVDDEEELIAYTTAEIQRLLTAALKRRNGCRFVLALAMGTRQGETLGFKWERLDESTRVLKVRKGLQFQKWQHGCDDPHECGARLHKTKPCKPGCKLKRHQKACPPPCGPDCTKHASSCPERHSGGLVEVDVKSKAGRRSLVLPGPLFSLVMKHKATQDQERRTAGTEWHEGGWMFCQPNGRPIGASADWAEWKSLLAEADVRDEKLHLARHTAATVLALLNVAPRVAMDFMGWSDPSMMLRYQHVTEEMRRQVADGIDGLLWAGTDAPGGAQEDRDAEETGVDDDGESELN
ncbi:tyrosine-type recombinase/integrase family protein [Catenulispora sp. NF23]|uniref:tyrosine-type recombinase/integrase n=1 Tax=Catenulispora pinistramenti TaxID=2705254 RepID=UPI001BAD564F|nr:tyrosine-type recombinase/integrase [Catenulispora pinistramenti]MBS2534157.1 tyrosine-type recombinase/integrase family protein [Catenulispora pinistramenti]